MFFPFRRVRDRNKERRRLIGGQVSQKMMEINGRHLHLSTSEMTRASLWEFSCASSTAAERLILLTNRLGPHPSNSPFHCRAPPSVLPSPPQPSLLSAATSFFSSKILRRGSSSSGYFPALPIPPPREGDYGYLFLFALFLFLVVAVEVYVV